MGMSPFIRSLRAKVGNDLLVLVGVSAIVLNDAGEVLLVRSTEIGSWMPVGGGVEPGEEPAVAAEREVFEESGLRVVVEHLVGVYDGPAATYANGDRINYTTVVFRCRALPGDPKPDGEETIEARFFAADALPPLRADHSRNIEHALARRPAAFFVTAAGTDA